MSIVSAWPMFVNLNEAVIGVCMCVCVRVCVRVLGVREGVDGEKLGNQDLRDLNINFPNSSNPNVFKVSYPAELGAIEPIFK